MSIRFIDVSFSYAKKPVFSRLNLEIPENKWIAITGDCGTGKSTLAKMIAGILKPDSGRIEFPQVPSVEYPNFGYLFQNPEDQFVHFFIEREIAFNLENRNYPIEMMMRKVHENLEKIGLFDRRKDSPNRLSGGEKQRLALAGMMISEPKYLILDEPSSYLDILAQNDLIQSITTLHANGVEIFWITQNEREKALSEFCIEVSDGDARCFPTKGSYS
ncbi:MAG: ABC transporter ATP-binding protein [Candidatus Marinimicrobia bacterium]|nr:ABC transporter ATP-binding protein [Candidatus Neomarinimicrobiota bacterium]